MTACLLPVICQPVPSGASAAGGGCGKLAAARDADLGRWDAARQRPTERPCRAAGPGSASRGRCVSVELPAHAAPAAGPWAGAWAAALAPVGCGPAPVGCGPAPVAVPVGCGPVPVAVPVGGVGGVGGVGESFASAQGLRGLGAAFAGGSAGGAALTFGGPAGTGGSGPGVGAALAVTPAGPGTATALGVAGPGAAAALEVTPGAAAGVSTPGKAVGPGVAATLGIAPCRRRALLRLRQRCMHRSTVSSGSTHFSMKKSARSLMIAPSSFMRMIFPKSPSARHTWQPVYALDRKPTPVPPRLTARRASPLFARCVFDQLGGMRMPVGSCVRI